MDVEIWTDIKHFEGLYKISNFGNIVSLKKRAGLHKGYMRPEQPMKLHVHTNFYQVVWLRKGKIHQKFYVHRLVAIHFLEAIEGKDYVNHKDKDRMHNHVRNLEYMTHAENMHHRDNYKRPVVQAAAVEEDDTSNDINPDDIDF